MDPILPPRCAAEFRPLRTLVSRPSGVVLLAQQASLDRPVILKLLPPGLLDGGARERFAREAQLTSLLAHPNVVTVLDHGIEEELAWIAFEYVEGGTAADLLAGGPIPVSELVRVGHQVAMALEVAHAQGILHRDVKPSNILRFREGWYKLADFGIARWLSQSSATSAGQLIGTPRYIAPEQIVGLEATPQSDLYALGISLFELATGTPPFDVSELQLLLEYHLKVPIRAPSTLRRDLPVELDRLVQKLAAKDVADRPASAAALVKDLENLLVRLEAGGEAALGAGPAADGGRTATAIITLPRAAPPPPPVTPAPAPASPEPSAATERSARASLWIGTLLGAAVALGAFVAARDEVVPPVPVVESVIPVTASSSPGGRTLEEWSEWWREQQEFFGRAHRAGDTDMEVQRARQCLLSLVGSGREGELDEMIQEVTDILLRSIEFQSELHLLATTREALASDGPTGKENPAELDRLRTQVRRYVAFSPLFRELDTRPDIQHHFIRVLGITYHNAWFAGFKRMSEELEAAATRWDQEGTRWAFQRFLSVREGVLPDSPDRLQAVLRARNEFRSVYPVGEGQPARAVGLAWLDLGLDLVDCHYDRGEWRPACVALNDGFEYLGRLDVRHPHVSHMEYKLKERARRVRQRGECEGPF